MSAPESRSVPDSSSDSPLAGSILESVRGGSPRRGPLWLGGMLGAVLAALVTWRAVESKQLEVQPAKVQYNMMGTMITDVTGETRTVALRQTAARVYGVFGGLLGLALGVAAGLALGRCLGAALGGAVGLLAGAALGFVAPLVVLPLYHRLAGDSVGEMVPALLMHCGMWIPLGAAAGAALGLAAGARCRVSAAALGGAVGVAIGAGVYEIVGATLMPLADTSLPIAATASARLLALVLTALPCAAGAVLAVGNPPARAKGGAA